MFCGDDSTRATLVGHQPTTVVLSPTSGILAGLAALAAELLDLDLLLTLEVTEDVEPGKRAARLGHPEGPLLDLFLEVQALSQVLWVVNGVEVRLVSRQSCNQVGPAGGLLHVGSDHFLKGVHRLVHVRLGSRLVGDGLPDSTTGSLGDLFPESLSVQRRGLVFLYLVLVHYNDVRHLEPP